MQKPNLGRTLSFIGLFLLLGGLGIRPLQAADAVVGTGTVASCTEAAFNAALATVQASSSGTITFNCGGAATITLTSGKVITKAVTINGGGNITLNGGDAVRHFYVDIPAGLTLQNITLRNGYDNTYGGGSILSLGTLALTNSTIRDSNVSSAYSGGAIMSLGLVTMSGSLIENNTGGSVGGLYLFGESADATVTNSIFRNNRTTSDSYGFGGAVTAWDGADFVLHDVLLTQNQARSGGAVYLQSASSYVLIDQGSSLTGNSATVAGGAWYGNGTLTVMNTTIADNTAVSGGGMYQVDGTILLHQTTLSGNTATGNTDGHGGALFVQAGVASLYDSTLDSNESILGYGGGVYISGGVLNLVRSTVSRNNAVAGGGIYAVGNSAVTIVLTNVTISQNSAAATGGGGVSFVDVQSTLNNVTFYNNQSGSGSSLKFVNSSGILKNVILQTGFSSNCSVFGVGGITSAGFNLADDVSCGLVGNGDLQNTDPKLGILQNNGGLTETHLLQVFSPALDSGQCGIYDDQRGVARPQGGICDKGAVEGASIVGTLVKNGLLFNMPLMGSGGADLSTVQSALTLTTYGMSVRTSLDMGVADDFTIPAGEKWLIDTMSFPMYQTGSTTASTITGININIYDGDPSAGGKVIASSTNMVGSVWTGGYRVFDTATQDTSRPIMSVIVDFNNLELTAGTYWVECRASGSLSSGPFAPLSTISGQTETGNALHKNAGTWEPAVSGTLSWPQGYPFSVNGVLIRNKPLFLPMIVKS